MTDLIYLDLQAKNLSAGRSDTQIEFVDNRDSIIVNNGADYELSVVRFQVDTVLLPVFTARIKTNSAFIDPQDTVYVVSMTRGAFFGTLIIQWEPEDLSVPVPTPPAVLNPQEQISRTTYYNCYNYQHFINLINKNLLQIFNDLKGFDPTTPGSAPYLAWNTDTLTAELVCSSIFDTEVPGNVNIYFNSALYNLFSSFSAEKVFELTQDLDYRLLPTANNGYNVVNGNIVLKQNYSTVANWSPVSSIVLASNNIGSQPNLVSQPLILRDNATVPISGYSNSTINIIADISTNIQSSKPNILYTPSAQYRLVSLFSSSPLTNISIGAFWKSTGGEYFPLLFPSGGSASIKLLFQKKKDTKYLKK